MWNVTPKFVRKLLDTLCIIRPGSITADANIFAQYLIYAFTAHKACGASNNLHPEGSLKTHIMANIAYTTIPYEMATKSGSGLNEIIGGQLAIAVGGITAARILAGFIPLSALGALAVMVSTGSRIIVAAAHRDYIPFFSTKLRKWNPRTDTPLNALAIQAIWGSLIIIFCPGSDPFKFLVSVSQHSAWFYYGLTVLGLLILRQRGAIRRQFVPKAVLIGFVIFASFIFFAAFAANNQGQNSPQNNDNKTDMIVNCQIRKIEGCPQDPKKSTYSYYLPYITSVILMVVGVICWYFYYAGIQIVCHPKWEAGNSSIKSDTVRHDIDGITSSPIDSGLDDDSQNEKYRIHSTT
ncbi:hypothetical protein G9A89_000805 [Geosiphon pyriformis]|nr:hypothetical protein G9A89_000805 [Geosiphon pyriformis]